ncbi:MAG TPA: hypothetical protein VKE74_20455 [Gemmataceae bacterium]|nr:hypothetical protein [Gemmataceae bacterium]
MTAELLRLPAAEIDHTSPPTPTHTPDPAFAALPRLTRLRDALTAPRPVSRPSRWREPAVFFFDSSRQSEYTASREVAHPEPGPLAERIAAELPALFAFVEVRRVARAIPGLREAAAATRLPAAKDLAELLAIPDDETVLVLHPQTRTGFRLFVRGVADVAQFHLLMLDAAGELLPGSPLPSRFRTACAEADPVIPAGVPMTAEARFQLFQPSAVQPDGSIPTGFRGCEHWLWGSQPLAALPRVDGERVVLLGEPAFRQTWEVERRFPAMRAEVRLLEVLGAFQVAERLGRLVGQPVPVRADEADIPVLRRAA